MDCSVGGIAKAVTAADKNQAEVNVRKVIKTSEVERAKAASTAMGYLTQVIKRANPTLDGKKVNVLNVREDNGEFYLKYSLGKAKQVLETRIDETTFFETKSPNFELDKHHIKKFYSDYDAVSALDGFEELALDITNNPEKIVETAQALIEADTYHNDETHNRTLFQQLGRIQDTLVEMVPELNIHINNAGDKNTGSIDVDHGNVLIEKGIGGSKSLMEIYVHELYHAVTHFAISKPTIHSRGATSRIEKVRENFLKNTKEDDLVRMSGGKLTSEDASDIIDHMTDPNVGLHEFVALAMTNKAVMNQLKVMDTGVKQKDPDRPLFYKLLDAVEELFNFLAIKVSGEPKGDDLQRMIHLVNRLHSAHKKPLESKRLMGVRNLVSVLEPIERGVVDYFNKKYIDDQGRPDRNSPKENEGDFKYYTRLAGRSFFDAQARDIIQLSLSTGPTILGYSPFAAENTLPTIIRDFFESDRVQDIVERLGMVSQVIDQQREYRALHVSESVTQSFDRQLSENEEKLLTDVVLDTDLTSIHHKSNIEELLVSNTAINIEVKNIAKKLKALGVSKPDLNFYQAQTDLLANYMVNHEDNIALLKNARNIAQKIDTPNENMDISEEIIDLVDEMASLKALKRTKKAKRVAVRDLWIEQPVGVDNLISFAQGQKDYAEETLFPLPSDKINMIKGYSAQITDPDIDITIAPLSQERELKKQGYVLKKELVKHEFDGNPTATGLYVSNTFVNQRFHRVGMRMTDKGRRGTTVVESYAISGSTKPTLRAARDIQKMKSRKKEVINLMMKGKYSPTAMGSDSMISPVFNKVGKVKDFAYGLDKDVKIDILDMERKASTVLGRTAASTFDKDKTEQFNRELMKVIEQDAKENMREGKITNVGNNLKEYIKIEKDSTNEQVRDLWKILPNDVKTRHPEGFVLRRDLMYSALGYREMSIVDLPGVKNTLALTPEVFSKLTEHAVRFAEKLWQEMIKISKVDIIIRTPGVFIGNVVSNFMLMYASGYSFAEITKLKFQGANELKLYVDNLKESIKLEAKVDAKIATKQEQRRLGVLRNNIENSPVKDLIDEGFYTTIIEETEHGQNTGSYFNRKAKKKLANMPKMFSDGVNLLYITENTKLFKLVEKSIQASDFAARYAQYHLMVEQGISKKQAATTVRDNFINYNKPNSRFLEWTNQMGFVMFTKYFTRIQRVLREQGKKHPLKMFLAILAQDYVLGDIEDVTDQSILVKDMGNLFYSPWDNLMRVITPSSAEAVDWALNRG